MKGRQFGDARLSATEPNLIKLRMLSPSLNQCKAEAALIGSMLTNYGELEFCLMHCLGSVVGDVETALRIVYRDRGEDRRINICDTLMRKHFMGLGLEGLFVETIDQVRHCKIIRNQYAHSWFSWSAFSVGWGEGPHPRKVTLKLVSLEDAVADSSGIKATPKNLPLELLEEQAAYFLNAQEWIMWLQSQADAAADKPWSPKPARPKRAPKPDRWSNP